MISDGDVYRKILDFNFCWYEHLVNLTKHKNYAIFHSLLKEVSVIPLDQSTKLYNSAALETKKMTKVLFTLVRLF